MDRRSNIFHNIVTDEDSTTEVLCNLMRFGAFRRLLLAKLFSPECAATISFDDIGTQVDLGSFGRADIAISNGNVSAIVEVKVEQYCGLTDNQPNGYLSYLAKERAAERWLVFLVPTQWMHFRYLEEALNLSSTAKRGIRTRVLSWEDVVTVIEESDLQELSPFIDEFYQLLLARIRPTPIVFSAPEVVMLFSKEFPNALSKLDGLIGEIQKKSNMYRSQQQRARALCPEEYGLYFSNARNQQVLWFGAWTEFWKEEGIPLCFGVDDKWPAPVRDAFRTAYKGTTKRFQKWTLGWVPQEVFASENAVDKVWGQLAPVLEAVVSADHR